jgi:hypothetical protein
MSIVFSLEAKEKGMPSKQTEAIARVHTGKVCDVLVQKSGLITKEMVAAFVGETEEMKVMETRTCNIITWQGVSGSLQLATKNGIVSADNSEDAFADIF